MEKHLPLYFFFSYMKRSKFQMSVLLKKISFLYTNQNHMVNICSFYFSFSSTKRLNTKFRITKIILLKCSHQAKETFLLLQETTGKKTFCG